MKLFKTISGETVNVINHTLNILRDYPNVTIHIGTDSQTKMNTTVYSTVIAYRYGNRGVHYIVHKQTLDRNNDMWSRLWREAEMSIEIAEWIKQQINVNIQIDMDYNEDQFCKSHVLIAATKGWANSLGYHVNVKPHIQVATRAANYHCQ